MEMINKANFNIYDDKLLENILDDNYYNKASEIVNMIVSNPLINNKLNMIREYDLYTYNHCKSVSILSVSLALYCGFNSRDIINIAVSSLLHDIGKCKIDISIINKPSKLTCEEYEILKNHSLYGYEMTKNMDFLDDVVSNTILYHHENYDGSGYPCGLSCDEIPISSSITRICDVYDALMSIRSYKKGYSKEKSIAIIKKKINTKFDKDIADAFLFLINDNPNRNENTKKVLKINKYIQ